MSEITIHMIVPGADRASASYQDVFSAKERRVITYPDGRLIHVEVRVGRTSLISSRRVPRARRCQTTTGGYVGDRILPAVRRRRRRVGASSGGRRYGAPNAAEHPFGERDGQIVDPFGYRWGLTQQLRDVSLKEMSRAAAQMFGG